MGRHGVSYIDITQAAISIKNQGLEPTVDRVREYLGTGSKSTIAPLLRKWKEKSQGEEQENADQLLPTDLLSSVHDLYESIEKRAQLKIDNIEKTYIEEKTSLTENILQKEKEINEIQQALTEIDRAHHEKTAAYTSLYAEQQKYIEKMKEEEQSHQITKGKLKYLEENHKRLLEDQRALQKNFEYYQIHIAEEHQKSKEQWIERVRDLEMQIADYRQSEKDMNHLIMTLRKNIHDYQTKCLLEEQVFKSMQKTLQDAQNTQKILNEHRELDRLNQKKSEEAYEYLKQQYQTLEKKYELGQHQKTLLEKNNAFLYQMLEEEKKSQQDLKKTVIALLENQHLTVQNPEEENTHSYQEQTK